MTGEVDEHPLADRVHLPQGWLQAASPFAVNQEYPNPSWAPTPARYSSHNNASVTFGRRNSGARPPSPATAVALPAPPAAAGTATPPAGQLGVVELFGQSPPQPCPASTRHVAVHCSLAQPQALRYRPLRQGQPFHGRVFFLVERR